MKKIIIIITMVGTSLFENYREKNKPTENFVNHYNYFVNNKLRSEKYNDESGRIRIIKDEINKWIKSNKDPNISAEVKSLKKISEEIREDISVYLLASDTVLSKLAGEILKEWIPEIILNCKIEQFEVFKNLQIWDRSDFTNGMVDLINDIYKVAGEYWANVAINITGGYKTTIPYLTVLAQVNQCPIYYIFEDTDALIKIPYVPMDIKWEIFEKYENLFSMLERQSVAELKNIKTEDYQNVIGLLESADNLYSLNPIGIVLWEKYKNKFDIFYVSEAFKDYIKNNNQYEKITKLSLVELKRRLKENPSDPDLDHKLKNVQLGEYKCFKHKEENLQVRILYKSGSRKTRYGIQEFDIYAGLIRIGGDVHNVESEYVEDFKRNLMKLRNTDDYKLFKITKKEVQNV